LEEEGDPLEDHLKTEAPEEIPPVEHNEQEGTLLDEPDYPDEPIEGLDMDESHYQWDEDDPNDEEASSFRLVPRTPREGGTVQVK